MKQLLVMMCSTLIVDSSMRASMSWHAPGLPPPLDAKVQHGRTLQPQERAPAWQQDESFPRTVVVVHFQAIVDAELDRRKPKASASCRCGSPPSTPFTVFYTQPERQLNRRSHVVTNRAERL